MHVLGIDIGGSRIKSAPVNIHKGILSRDRLEMNTPKNTAPDALTGTCAELVQRFKWNGPVGCAFPGVIKNGVAYSAAHVHKSWIGTNGEKLLSEQTGCPVMMLNDADAAGLAEMEFGAGKKQKGVTIMLTLGTGIGSAIFIDGKLLPNTEFGHMEVRGKDAEERAAARVRIRKRLSWKDWAAKVNEFLARMEVLFSPDVFILGGGVSQNQEKFIPLLKARAEIRPALMGNNAGIIGAASAAGRRFPEVKP